MKIAIWAALLAAACAKSGPKNYGQPGTQAAFDLDSDPAQPGLFFELPYPSDLRLTADGKPQLASFPNPRGVPMLEISRGMAMQRARFPTMPAGPFRSSPHLPPAREGW